MVQYYRDLCARDSEMLSPLTDMVGDCVHTKVAKANKTKKKPWHRDAVHQTAFDNVKQPFPKSLSWPTLTTHRDLRSILIVPSINKELSLLKTSGHWCFSVEN